MHPDSHMRTRGPSDVRQRERDRRAQGYWQLAVWLPPLAVRSLMKSCALAAVLPLAFGLSILHAEPAHRGEWRTYRHDRARTGRSLGSGRITEPTILWRFQTAPTRWLIELVEGQGTRELDLSAAADLAPGYWHAARADWNQDQRRVDLDGDGKPTVVTEQRNLRFGHFLPGAKGVQKVYFEDGMAVKKRPDGPKKPVAHGMLYRYDQGGEQLVWKTKPEPQAEIPLCAVADMDGDGRDDLAVSTWWRVMVFDLATGEKTMECRWHKGRNYGHFQLADLDDDPHPECIVFADFMIHLNVLDNDGERLSLAWRKEVEFQLFGKRKTLRVPDNVVLRCGDGRKTLVLNLFNDTDDERWHVMVYEPMTGKVVTDLPDRYLHGIADLDGDGRDELLLSSANGRAVPRVGPLYIGRMAGNRLETASVPVAGAWLTVRAPLRRDRASCAAEGRTSVVTTDLDADGRREAWLREPSANRSSERIRPVLWSEGNATLTASRLDLPRDALVKALATRDRTDRHPAGLMLQVDVPFANEGDPCHRQARLRTLGATVRSRHAGETPHNIPVVGKPVPTEPPTIIVPTATGDLLALRGARDPTERPSVAYRCPGRAQTDDASTFYGIALADLTGDGRLESLSADGNDAGLPVLAARDADGRVVWARTFQHFAAGPTQWNTSGILYWATGRFRKADRIDVLVTLRRSVMHTDETYLLNGRNGEVLWHQDNAEQRGWGGKPFAVADCTADGLDDVVCQYPDIHFVASGKTGQRLKFATWPHAQLGGWSAYGFPAIVRRARQGPLAVLTGHCHYTVALWSLAGKPLWHTPYLDGSTACPAVADFNGDGAEELIVPAYQKGLRCYDLATGKREATMKLPNAAVSDVAACDMNGDGRIDAVFACGAEVWAVTVDPGGLAPLWKCELPSRGYAPIVADSDGDGPCEILLLTQSGELVCIGSR